MADRSLKPYVRSHAKGKHNTGYYQPQRDLHGTSNEATEVLVARRVQDSGDIQTSDTVNLSTKVILSAYLVALLLPIEFNIFSLGFNSSRAFLTLLALPLLISALVKVRLHFVDILILAYVCWAAVAYAANHGIVASIQPSGSHFVEVVGSYFLARLFVQTPVDFRFWSNALLFSVSLLLPFAIYEFFTGNNIALSIVGKFATVYQYVDARPRLGMHRVHTVFDHPILFGVFCAGAFSSTVLLSTYGKNVSVRSMSMALVSMATFVSLSAGAYLNIAAQILFIGWHFLFQHIRRKWRLLLAIILVNYVFVDLLSNRTPFEVFITYFTFDFNTAHARVIIWRYGTAEVWRHPIFGIGLGDWQRPEWLASSIDNFWLLRAMRFGLPGFFLLVCSVFLALKGTVRRMDSKFNLWRICSLVQFSTIAATSIALTTVDAWNSSHSLFFFALGAMVALNQSYEILCSAPNQLHKS